MLEILKANLVPILVFLGCYVGAGVIAFLFGHKSQIDSWAEANPRAAAVLKLLRAIGFDPWMLLQSLSLFFKGKLPPSSSGDGRPTPPDTSVPRVTLQRMTALATVLALLILPGCATWRDVVYPTAVECGGAVGKDVLDAVAVILRGENYQHALDELARDLGKDGPAAVLCAVQQLLSDWKARPQAAPTPDAAHARAFLARTGSTFK